MTLSHLTLHRNKPKRTPSSNTGYACPKCEGCRTMVKDSRQWMDGEVRRRRHCPDCGFRFSTVEVILEDNSLTKIESEKLKLLRKMLPRLFALADLIDELRAEHD